MGINWRHTPKAFIKNKGPVRTSKLTRLFLRGKDIVDSIYNTYTLQQARELINSGVAFTEEEELIKLLGGS